MKLSHVLALVLVLLKLERVVHGGLLFKKCKPGYTMHCTDLSLDQLDLVSTGKFVCPACPVPEPTVCPVPEPTVCPVPEPVVCPIPEPTVCPVPEPTMCPVPEPTVIMPPTSWLRTVSELSHGVKALFSVMFPIVMACGTWISRRIHVRRCGSIVRNIETQTD